MGNGDSKGDVTIVNNKKKHIYVAVSVDPNATRVMELGARLSANISGGSVGGNVKKSFVKDAPVQKIIVQGGQTGYLNLTDKKAHMTVIVKDVVNKRYLVQFENRIVSKGEVVTIDKGGHPTEIVDASKYGFW